VHAARRARARRTSTRMSRALPSGWEHRANQASARDLALGAAVSRNFSAHGALETGEEIAWRSSDVVAEAWFRRIEDERASAETAGGSRDDADARASGLGAVDWDARARARALEAGRWRDGGSARAGERDASARTNADATLGLVSVATLACESLAAALDARLVSIPEEDRARFAAAVKRSLDAVVRCR